MYFSQSNLLFPGQRRIAPRNVLTQFPQIEQIWLETSFGKVESWFQLPINQDSSQPASAVIFAHGNGELIHDWPWLSTGFKEMGIAILLVEYPGYGNSDGKPSQKTIKETFISAYDWLQTKEGIDPRRIIAYGRSVGGGAVCELTKHRNIAALILQSTFTRVHHLVKKNLFPSFLIQSPFYNLKTVKSYPGPILIIHGKYDTLIPYEHGVKLAQTNANSTFITYHAGHNDCPPDWNRFWKDIYTFLNKHHFIQ
jgi:dipeptidyl aminopeptidase/acylaminoacyl peptidase